MGTVTFRLQGEDAGAVREFLRLDEAQRRSEMASRRAALAADRHNRELLKTGSAAGQVERAMTGVASSAARMVAGMASVGGAVSAIKTYVESLKEMRDLQVQIGQRGLATQTAALPLAEQEGLLGREGLVEAVRRSFATAQAGSLPLEVGGTIRLAAMSQIRGGQQVKEMVADLAARVIGKTGSIAGGPQAAAEEGAALVELLANAGVRTEEGAQLAVAQINQSLLDTPELGAGKFALASVKGGTAAMALGTGLGEVLARSAQARQVAGGSADAGAELMRQVVQNITGQDEPLNIIGRRLGITRQRAMELPPHEQLAALQSAIEGARSTQGDAGVMRLLGKVEGRTRTQFLRFFSPAAVETYRATSARIADVNVPEVMDLYRQAADTDVARAQRMENERRLREAESAHRRFALTQTREEAQRRLEEMKATGQIGWVKKTLSFDETLVSQMSDIVEAERLGLVRPGGEPGGVFGEGGAATILRAAKRRMGMGASQRALGVEDLNPSQRRRLAEFMGEQAAEQPTAEGRAFYQAGAARAAEGLEAPVNPLQQIVQHNYYGDLYHLGDRDALANEHPFVPKLD